MDGLKLTLVMMFGVAPLLGITVGWVLQTIFQAIKRNFR